ncbi:MAG TPA: PrsW family glutamic-type intramembrane protease [Thermoflexus sp.]|nr:PrsW family glutamic-type intramembrane protease [Thermoflexus sp.]
MSSQAINAIVVGGIGTLIPTGLYLFLVWWFDRYEKEPLHLIGAALFWGSIPAMALAALARPALLALSSALFGGAMGGLWGNAILLPIAEEIAKGLFLIGLFLLYRREIDSLYDGFLYGSLVGFAFAAADTILSAPARNWGLIGAAERTLLLGLAHAFFTGWVGLGFAAARLSHGGMRWAWPVLGGLVAIGLHILRNWALTYTFWNPNLAALEAVIYWSGVLLLVGILAYGMAREGAWVARYLADEVRDGVMPAALYETLRSPTARLAYRWGPLLQGDVVAWRRRGLQLQVAAELAFRKHQRQALGEAAEAEIRRLREMLRQLT